VRVFNRITLRGAQGSISWSYREVAKLGAWSVQRERDEAKGPQPFELRATITGPIDGFALRQRPLLFTAPRRGGRNAGMFCFPVQELRVNEQTLTATLGPPEY
jgi:hypothetical protein